MGGDFGQGIALGTNGVILDYASTAPVNLHSNHQMQIDLDYDGTALSVVLLDLSAQVSCTNRYSLDIAAIIGVSLRAKPARDLRVRIGHF